jgi:hypothetical protein
LYILKLKKFGKCNKKLKLLVLWKWGVMRVGVCVVEIYGLLAQALFSLGNGILCYTGDVM